MNACTPNVYEHLTALADRIPATPLNRAWKDRVRQLSALLEVEGVFDGLDATDQLVAAAHVAGCLVQGGELSVFRARATYLRTVPCAGRHDAEGLAQAVERAGEVSSRFP